MIGLICWAALMGMFWCSYLVVRPITDKEFITKSFSALRTFAFFVVIWTAHIGLLTDMWWTIILGFIVGVSLSTYACNETKIKGLNKILFFFVSVFVVIATIGGTFIAMYVQIIGI